MAAVELQQPSDDPRGSFVRLCVFLGHATSARRPREGVEQHVVTDVDRLDRNLLDVVAGSQRHIRPVTHVRALDTSPDIVPLARIPSSAMFRLL